MGTDNKNALTIHWHRLLVSLASLIIGSHFLLAAAQTRNPLPGNFPGNASKKQSYKILESNARRLTTEFRTPEFLATKRVYGGKEYHSIRIPGYHQTFKPGEPQLPFQGYLLG
ncbi:MAG: hypothetical protein ACE5I1_33005, partial [bacterium]